jgi:hypothetical protein
MLSLKGSPGVTTLACLVAAAWPGPGPAVVVEADPAGGDLATRFALSSRAGWPSLSSSTRRSDEAPRVDPHLQRLPGGLPVLVCARGGDRRSARSPEGQVLRSGRVGDGPSGLTLVDLGRCAEDDEVSDSWLNLSDVSVLVVRGDPSGVVQVRERADGLLHRCSGRLGIVVVGGGRYGCREVSEFTGITALGEVPFDPAAADVASGASGAGHRLERSLLWIAAGRLAVAVAARIEDGWEAGQTLDHDAVPPGATASISPVPRRTRLDRILRLSRRTPGGAGTGRKDRDGRTGRKDRDGRTGRKGRYGPGNPVVPDELAPVVAEAYAEATDRADA